MRFLSYPLDLPVITWARRDALTPNDGDLVCVSNSGWFELQRFECGQWTAVERMQRAPVPRFFGDLRFDAAAGMLNVPLWYPRAYDPSEGTPDHPKSVEIDLICVRASDSIRIEYDFERDGYSIKQASKFEWAEDDEVQDPDWQEVTFVRAWARDERRKLSHEGA